MLLPQVLQEQFELLCDLRMKLDKIHMSATQLAATIEQDEPKNLLACDLIEMYLQLQAVTEQLFEIVLDYAERDGQPQERTSLLRLQPSSSNEPL